MGKFYSEQIQILVLSVIIVLSKLQRLVFCINRYYFLLNIPNIALFKQQNTLHLGNK